MYFAVDIIQQIDKWAEMTPDRVVYDYLGDTKTYKELKEYSDKVAQYLVGLNLQKRHQF